MLKDIIEIIKGNKLNVSIAGGVLILATAYGTCTVDPNEEAIKEAVQEKVEEKKGLETPVEEKAEEEKTEENPAVVEPNPTEVAPSEPMKEE